MSIEKERYIQLGDNDHSLIFEDAHDYDIETGFPLRMEATAGDDEVYLVFEPDEVAQMAEAFLKFLIKIGYFDE